MIDIDFIYKKLDGFDFKHNVYDDIEYYIENDSDKSLFLNFEETYNDVLTDDVLNIFKETYEYHKNLLKSNNAEFMRFLYGFRWNKEIESSPFYNNYFLCDEFHEESFKIKYSEKIYKYVDKELYKKIKLNCFDKQKEFKRFFIKYSDDFEFDTEMSIDEFIELKQENYEFIIKTIYEALFMKLSLSLTDDQIKLIKMNYDI